MSNSFIVYVSNRTNTDDPFLARDIAIDSSRNNAMQGISGILMGVGRHFLQVLEGDEEVLEPLLDKIGRDPRHTDLQVLYRGKMEERIFGRWSMGCVSTKGGTEDGEQHFEDIAREMDRLCNENNEEAREALKDLIVEIPKRFAKQEVTIV